MHTILFRPTLAVAFLALLFSTPALSQEYSISGKILDERRMALPGVNIRLVNFADTSLLIRTDTGPDGGFTISRVRPSAYRLDFTAIGRQPISLSPGRHRSQYRRKLTMAIVPVPLG